MKGYPSWFSGKLVHSFMLALFVSGCLLVPSMLVTRLEWDDVWKFSSDARVWITATHVLAAFVWIAATGALWSIHMRYWWRKNENRFLGGLLVFLTTILTLSAILILYSGSSELSLGMSVLHTVLGLVIFIPYFLHIRRARPRR
jgi:heme A synthase